MLKVLKKTALWFPIVLIGGVFASILLGFTGWMIYSLFILLHEVMGKSVWIAYVSLVLGGWFFVSLNILARDEE